MAAFTSIAAGVGLATSAASTGMSFAQAGKQKRLQRTAEAKAAEMMQEARKKLEVNFYDQLAIQREPYELEREALVAAGAQAIEAGRESERGAAAIAGRVQMAQQQGQRDIASAMGQELLGLEKLSAQEDARLRDVGVQLDLEEVAGAQLAAANAQEMSAKATAQGMQGIQRLGAQVASMAPLFEKSASAKQFKNIQEQAKKMGMNPQQLQQLLEKRKNMAGVDFSGVGKMPYDQFQDFMTQMPASKLKEILSGMQGIPSEIAGAVYGLDLGF